MTGLDAAALRTLSAQVGTIEQDEIRASYLAFATASQLGLRRVPTHHGYISNEIRFYDGEAWFLSAVLNKSWILFYFRWPAFRDGWLRQEQVRERFPEAEFKSAEKEYKLRVHTLDEALDVLDFLEHARP